MGKGWWEVGRQEERRMRMHRNLFTEYSFESPVKKGLRSEAVKDLGSMVLDQGMS